MCGLIITPWITFLNTALRNGLGEKKCSKLTLSDAFGLFLDDSTT